MTVCVAFFGRLLVRCAPGKIEVLLGSDEEKRVSGAREVSRVARLRFRGRVVGWWCWAWQVLLCWLLVVSVVWLRVGWSCEVAAAVGLLIAGGVEVASECCLSWLCVAWSLAGFM